MEHDMYDEIASYLPYKDVVRMRCALGYHVPYKKDHRWLKTLYELESYTRDVSVHDPQYKESLSWCARYRESTFVCDNAWTEEQLRIINNEAEVTTVQAFAGSGKTTTIFEYMRRRPEKKILYLAFNKELEQSAKRKIATTDMTHVDIFTIHAFALDYMRKHGLLSEKVVVGVCKIKDLMTLYDRPIAFDVLKALRAYCAGDTDDLFISNEYNESYQSHIATQVQVVWKKMIAGEMRMSHDVYVKLFQTMRIDLPYDVIIVDEAQDCTPCQMSIFSRCAKRVFVGDIHQQIYTFRGVCDPFQVSDVLSLTKTFRFGFDLGDIVNAFLHTYKSEHMRMVTPKHAYTKVTHKKPLDGYTLICRTHQGVLEAAMTMRVPFYLMGVKPIDIVKETQICADLDRIYRDDFEHIHHRKLKAACGARGMCGTLDQFFDQFTRTYPDSQRWKLRIRMYKKYGNALLDMYAHMDAHMVSEKEDASVIITNVHQAKGLEFDTVVMHDDFETICFHVGDHIQSRVTPMHKEEYNLIYVAMTRAKRRLVLNKQLCFFVHTLKRWNHPYIEKELISTCAGCGERKMCYDTIFSYDDAMFLGTETSEIQHHRHVCATCF